MSVPNQNYSVPTGLNSDFQKRAIQSARAPSGSDLGFDPGIEWLNQTGVAATSAAYINLGNVAGQAVWQPMAGGSSVLSSLTGDSGTAVPSSGNIKIAGTANQVNTSASGSTVTLSLPSVVIVAASVTTSSFITSSATLGTTFTDNSITPTGSNTNIDLLVNGKGTGGVIHSRGLVGGDITIQSTNTDNTNAASRGGFSAAVGGASAGDPYVNFLVSGAGQYTMGIDNSVSDNFVLSLGASLGTNNIFSISNTTPFTTTFSQGGIDVIFSSTSLNPAVRVQNTDATASSTNAIFAAIQSGDTGGDCSIAFSVVSSTIWTMGLDNSTTNNDFVLAKSASLGTSNALSVDGSTSDVSVSTGNLAIASAAKSLRVKGGAVTDFIGTGTLTNGTVTINNTNIAATDRIFVSRISPNASTTLGILTYSIIASTSFTVTAAILGTPAVAQTGDVSSFSYFIVRQL